MEYNEISMFMDVKLDIHERKKETAPYKSWMKCLVKIEAIKCFPCYLRLTFTRDVENISESLCVRINIPGVTVRQATSRTKTHSYGVFWKQNRKRCCIFFALETQVSFDRHMKWLKMSIKNLELHRKEILETKRISRCNEVFSNDRDFINVKDGRNLQDILGPLPKIPDLGESNWSRRISEVSGIYEEIHYGDHGRRVSRASVASGIYEEMKLPADFETISEVSTPPPLPPRKRVNTYQSDNETVHRSYTHPETELAKKRKYLTVLENMFGRTKRCESVNEGKVSTAEELYALEQPTYDNFTPRTKRKENSKDLDKRNSFSSPNLSKNRHLNDLSELDDLISFSSDLQALDLSDSASVENISLLSEEISKDVENIVNDWNDCVLNVSSRIQPNFNFSFNSSTVNLVGANLNPLENPPNIVIEDLSGYCFMAPIKKNRTKSLTDSDKENEENEVKNENVSSAVYENMNALNEIYLNVNFENIRDYGHTYQNESAAQSDKQKSGDDNLHTTNADSQNTPRKSINFDEKVPSYYPNSCESIKVRKRNSSGSGDSKSNIRHTRGNQNENISPRKKGESQFVERKSSPKLTPLRSRKLEEISHSSTKNVVKPENIAQQNKVVSISIESFKNDNGTTKIDESTPRIYQKYATLARISPNKYLEKCAKKSTDINAVKKFASLPRFKKIDFSPLKIKINNVLQRHQSDGL